MASWVAVLDGVVIAGGDDLGTLADGFGDGPFGDIPFGSPIDSVVTAWLSKPPEGLGVPGLRVEDQTFPQRDGSQHYADWYEPRIVTLEDVTIRRDWRACDGPSARTKAAALMAAWSRRHEDVELVIFTDEHDPDADLATRAVTGPFGVVGRPRVADLTWLGQGTSVGQATLRFDAVDHRLYLLDADGTPGSGEITQNVASNDPYDSNLGGVIVSTAGLLRYWEMGPTNPALPGVVPASYGSVNGSVVSVGGMPLPTFNHEPIFLGSSRTAKLTRPTDSYIQLPGPATGSTVTLEFVFKTDPLPTFPDTGEVIFLSADGLYHVAYRTRDKRLAVRWNGTYVSFDFDEDPNQGHVALVQNGSTLSLYLNGVCRTGHTVAGVGTTTRAAQNWKVQCRGLLPGTGSTDVSDVAFYNVALTQAQVLEHFEAAQVPDYSTLSVLGNTSVPFKITFSHLIANGVRLYLNGSYVGISTNPAPVGQSVTLDTALGVLTYTSPTGKPVQTVQGIVGDPFLELRPGNNDFAVMGGDNSYLLPLKYRPAVISA